MRLRAVPDADYGKHKQVGDCSGQHTAKMLAPMRRGPLAEALHRLGQCKGIEQVITHPRTQRNMPAPPEIPQRGRKIRLPEVGHHLNAVQLRNTQYHINAAGKICILLQRVQQNGQQCHRTGQLGVIAVEDGGNRRGGQVCDGIFLHCAEQKQEQCTLGTLPVPDVTGSELRGHLSVAVDGTLDQLREKADEKQKAGVVFLCRVPTTVAVNQITDGLKRVKADAKRHNQPQ